MDNGGGVWSFMPGDEIELEVEVFTRARVKDVLAVFAQRGDPSGSGRGPTLAFHGDVYSLEKTSEGRFNKARLYLDEENSEPLIAGDYLLNALEAQTYEGKRLPADHLPYLTIRIEQEPPEEQTARVTQLQLKEEQ